MEALTVLGYGGAVIIGVTLGLIGGGGSILTVPVFVYLMGLDPVIATAYSLFVVGVAALVGGVQNLRIGRVSLKTGVVFAIPSLTAVFLTRRFIVPALPEELFRVGGYVVSRDFAIMMFFAIIMVLAAFSMIRKRRDENGAEADRLPPARNLPLIFLEGAVVGVVTGIVGAGGGFLIIPALVIFAKLPMKTAVGTSLLIISVKSLIGFTGDLAAGLNVDWALLALFSGLSIGGIFIGMVLARRIPGEKLRVGFGWFVLVMAAVIIFREIL